jgi:hypothetical protein
VTKHVERSVALFGAKADALDHLHSVAMECSTPDWDGYGAEAVNLEALYRAERLLRSLPEGFPLPEFSVEPDGAISDTHPELFAEYRRVRPPCLCVA